MSRPQFSKEYRTYGEWLKAQPRTSRYAKEIIRKHQYSPDKSLKQLRNLRIGDVDLSNVSWQSLTSQEKRNRNLSLQILRSMRKGDSLTQATEQLGLTKEFALEHLGTRLQKEGGNWKATKTDSLQSEMMIYAEGHGVTSIVVTNSRDRSRIGKYFSALQKALKTGDPSGLEKFKDMKIKDANGKEYRFETDLEELYEIQDTQEEPEFFEIYA